MTSVFLFCVCLMSLYAKEHIRGTLLKQAQSHLKDVFVEFAQNMTPEKSRGRCNTYSVTVTKPCGYHARA